MTSEYQHEWPSFTTVLRDIKSNEPRKTDEDSRFENAFDAGPSSDVTTSDRTPLHEVPQLDNEQRPAYDNAAEIYDHEPSGTQSPAIPEPAPSLPKRHLGLVDEYVEPSREAAVFPSFDAAPTFEAPTDHHGRSSSPFDEPVEALPMRDSFAEPVPPTPTSIDSVFLDGYVAESHPLSPAPATEPADVFDAGNSPLFELADEDLSPEHMSSPEPNFAGLHSIDAPYADPDQYTGAPNTFDQPTQAPNTFDDYSGTAPNGYPASFDSSNVSHRNSELRTPDAPNPNLWDDLAQPEAEPFSSVNTADAIETELNEFEELIGLGDDLGLETPAVDAPGQVGVGNVIPMNRSDEPTLNTFPQTQPGHHTQAGFGDAPAAGRWAPVEPGPDTDPWAGMRPEADIPETGFWANRPKFFGGDERRRRRAVRDQAGRQADGPSVTYNNLCPSCNSLGNVELDDPIGQTVHLHCSQCQHAWGTPYVFESPGGR